MELFTGALMLTASTSLRRSHRPISTPPPNPFPGLNTMENADQPPADAHSCPANAKPWIVGGLRGLTCSAGVVTSAAVVMVSVFVSVMFVSLVEMKQTGFGLAVAVLLDAVVVRIMILSALMTLLGDKSWWPSRAVLRARAAAAQVPLTMPIPVVR